MYLNEQRHRMKFSFIGLESILSSSADILLCKLPHIFLLSLECFNFTEGDSLWSKILQTLKSQDVFAFMDEEADQIEYSFVFLLVISFEIF